MSIHERVRKLERIVELLDPDKLEQRLTAAVDKVIGQGLEVEVKSQDEILADALERELERDKG